MIDTIDAVRHRAPDQFTTALQDIRDAGTDSLAFFGNGYAKEGGLSLQQNPDEFAALLVLLNRITSHRDTYLEIGSASGGTAVLIHAWTGFDEMYSIDDGQHPRYPETEKNFDIIPMNHLKADSHGPEARDFVSNLMFDVAFIDGDHSYEGVSQDIELVLPRLDPGAIVILHDIVACEGVHKAWNDSLRLRRWAAIAEYVGNEKPLGIGVGLVL